MVERGGLPSAVLPSPELCRAIYQIAQAALRCVEHEVIKENIGPSFHGAACYQAHIAFGKGIILRFQQFLAVDVEGQGVAHAIGAEVINSLPSLMASLGVIFAVPSQTIPSVRLFLAMPYFPSLEMRNM